MSDISWHDLVVRLRATSTDKDNMPRMSSERWLPVSLALEAADEIERLRAEVREAFRAGFSSWAGPANVAEVEAWAKEEELEWAEWSATRCSSTPTEHEEKVKP